MPNAIARDRKLAKGIEKKKKNHVPGMSVMQIARGILETETKIAKKRMYRDVS
jgi:hypothetical protein